MRIVHLMRGAVAALVMLAAGCQAFHGYRPLPVEIRDAETGQPIAGAQLRVSYPLVASAWAPAESIGTTGADGIVHLRAAPEGPAGVLLDVRAHGYLAKQKTLSIESVKAIEPAHFFEFVDRRPPPHLVLELYADPRPTLELVTPVGFRGQIQVELKIDEKFVYPAGERRFSYAILVQGTVTITGPPLFAHVIPLDFEARDEQGKRLERNPKGLELGFWPLTRQGDTLTFLVGTQAEYAALRDADRRTDPGTKQAPGSGKRGNGGRGRRGAPPITDPSLGGQ